MGVGVPLARVRVSSVRLVISIANSDIGGYGRGRLANLLLPSGVRASVWL